MGDNSNDTSSRTYFLKEAYQIIREASNQSDFMTEEYFQHLHDEGTLKKFIKLDGAIATDKTTGMDKCFDEPIVVEYLRDNKFEFDFIYEGKEYSLFCCDKEREVITAKELERYISENQLLDTKNKQPLKAEKKLAVNAERLIKLKQWIEEEIKNNAEFNHLCVAISRKEVWYMAIGELIGESTINAFFTYVNRKDPNLITFKKGTKLGTKKK